MNIIVVAITDKYRFITSQASMSHVSLTHMIHNRNTVNIFIHMVIVLIIKYVKKWPACMTHSGNSLHYSCQ